MNQFSSLKKKCAEWICSRCREGGCELKWGARRPPRAFIVDCERYKADKAINTKVADCLFVKVGASTDIAVVELKGGNPDVERAISQVQGGLDIGDGLLSGYRVDVCLPILVHSRRLHADDYKMLGRKKVTFRGLQRLVLVAKSGDAVENLWSKNSSRYAVP